ncbi:MAG: organic hydroperoxide reductase OsmC/OhrA [Halioglobus sp.]|jgi:organic hydroperoxide reductase OsmC/OhrA
MQGLPHNYVVTASAQAESNAVLSSAGLPDLETGPPAEFGGPGDLWSPETLFIGSVSDCFILTFRAIARASKLPWSSLECVANGTLERIERSTKFTAINIVANLQIPAGTDPDKARLLLEKSEASCLITQSMTATVHLETVVTTET